uniref:Uncharacterized protein n=1 Tax=Glossina austeni TaxID=7395 RepID=A0A1A9VNW4_GLOAU
MATMPNRLLAKLLVKYPEFWGVNSEWIDWDLAAKQLANNLKEQLGYPITTKDVRLKVKIVKFGLKKLDNLDKPKMTRRTALDAFLWYALRLGLRNAADRMSKQLISDGKNKENRRRYSEDKETDKVSEHWLPYLNEPIDQTTSSGSQSPARIDYLDIYGQGPSLVITCAVYMRCVEFAFPLDLVKRWDRRLYAVDNADLLHDQLDGSDDGRASIAASDDVNLQEVQDIECIINQEYTVHCKRDGDNHEVYVPFSFLCHYFDISRTMSSPASPLTTINGNSDSQAQSKFLWMHSTAKINIPKGKYDSRGVFMYFENYNVEIRDQCG